MIFLGKILRHIVDNQTELTVITYG